MTFRRSASSRPSAIEDCRLCRELAGAPDGTLALELTRGLVSDTRLHAGSGLTTIVPLGPLTEGHVLVVPNRHVLSFRELSHGERAAADRYIDWIGEAVAGCWGDVIAFEHGVGAARCAVGQCLDHAHMHLVPIPVPLEAAVAADFAGLQVASLAALEGIVALGENYLLCRAASGRWTSFSIDEALPSQYLRMKVHMLAGGHCVWDWRSDLGVERMLATRGRLSPILNGGHR